MKMNIGFTLAEALITIGIIGVIATLTLPTLTLDIQKQKIGPTLAKAVNSLENAHAYLLQKTDTSNIRSACEFDDNEDVGNAYVECMAKSANLIGSVVSKDGNYCIQTNDGIAFCPTGGISSSEKTSRKFYGEYFPLTIDIDANKNLGEGIDTFNFLVDLKGQLIPVGGRLSRTYGGSGSQDSIDWESGCNKQGMSIPAYCAGSIADNGWKVIYKF